MLRGSNLVYIIIFFGVITAYAQQPSLQEEPFGLTLGYIAPFNSFPSAESNLGEGYLFGFTHPKGAVEASLLFSNHKIQDVPFIKENSQADYVVFNLDFKYYFLENRKIKPYILAGVAWLDFTDVDAYNFYGIIKGDATYTGLGFNLGSGIDIYFTPHIGVSSGILYRYVSFTTDLLIFEEEEKAAEKLSGGTLNFNLGIKFVF